MTPTIDDTTAARGASIRRIIMSSQPISTSRPSRGRSFHYSYFYTYYMLATLTYKTLASGKPNYLNNLLIPYIPKRQLRSAFSSKLAVPCRKSAMAQSKSFSSSAVSVWNSLPHSVTSAGDLKTFRTLLKTHLFSDRQID